MFQKHVASIALLGLLSSPALASIPEAEIPRLINLIVQAESSGRPHIVGDEGRARGLMQIQKATWQEYTRISWDRAFDADWNLKIGEAHVRSIIKRYGRRASYALVIYTYNTGKFIKPGRKLPTWTKKHKNKIYRSVFRSVDVYGSMGVYSL